MNQAAFVRAVIRVDGHYNTALKRFGEELNQWVTLKRNLTAAKGRPAKEKEQWKLVVSAWEELDQREQAWGDVRAAFAEFQKAVDNE